MEELNYDTRISLAKAIVEARTEAGMSQLNLSKSTGIPQANISMIENGKANPSIKTLERIANALGRKIVIEMVFAPAEEDESYDR